MNSLNSRTLITVFSGTLMLALVLRTWFVMGLIEPVYVAGSSMVPALSGPNFSISCKKCQQKFTVGAEFPTERLECLACGFAANSAENLPIERGDRLMVDRTAFQFREPRRWEALVFHSPTDGQLTVKRVVGLLGETVQLCDGDVRINGKVATKSLSKMRALRQLVHEETSASQHWHGNGWRWNDSAWQIATDDDHWHWLAYRYPSGEPITDDIAYNAGLTRRVFPVRDLCFSANVRARGRGKLAVRFDDGSEQFSWEGGVQGKVLLDFFAFDRRCQVFLDGKLVASKSLDSLSQVVGTSTPFAIGARNLAVTVSDLRIDRDIYHASQNEELGMAEPMTPITLGKNEIYVLGDNVPVSLDSRQWGPVPLRFLIGKPLGVR